MILLVLIDNCVVLSVKVHTLFVLNGKLILITLNKQTNTTFVSLRGVFICFILCNIILSSKVCFNRMTLRLLSFDISRLLGGLAGSSVTLRFSSQIREKAFPKFLCESYQRKRNWAIKRPDVHMHGTIMLCLYYYVFLMSSYTFKMFLLALFGKLTIVLLESSLWLEPTVKQFENS